VRLASAAVDGRRDAAHSASVPRSTAIAISAGQWRSILTTALVLAVVFALCAVAGFLLDHEPTPDVRQVEIDREAPPPAVEQHLGGEVVSIDGGRLTLRTSEGLVELDLAPGAIVEELRRAPESRFEPGVAVNLGGERSDFGLVLTGVIAIEPQ